MITTTQEREVRDALLAGADAWGWNDADAYAAAYTEDATVVTTGGAVLRGREALREFMARGFAGPLAGTRSYDEPESVRIHGDAAAVVSRSGVLMPGEDEPAAERVRRATWTLVRQDGRWLVLAYHNCAIG